MSTATKVGFQSIEDTQRFLIQGEAINVGGFTVNQNFDPEIEHFIRRETVLWQLIKNKLPANSPTVKKIREGALPTVGFINRGNLSAAKSAPLQNSQTATQNDLSDPGQEVKAVAGTVQFNHFGRSMSEQQGRPYGEHVAEDTRDLLVSMARYLEMMLFQGDANADALAFNGIDKLMPTSNIVECNLTEDDPQSLIEVINRTVTRATTDRTIMRRITHILCTGAASLQFQREIGQATYYQSQSEIVPGYKVPGVMTSNGLVPIVHTPYINDVDGGAGNDIMRIYLLDIDSIEWRGVRPYGGEDSFEPQIFDITQFVNGDPLVEQRMALIYGTPYAKDRGRGIWRVDAQCEPGSVWNVSGT